MVKNKEKLDETGVWKYNKIKESGYIEATNRAVSILEKLRERYIKCLYGSTIKDGVISDLDKAIREIKGDKE